MGKLSDILNGGGANFNDRWNSTEAAGEFRPVPRGTFVCHATRGELSKTEKKETPYYGIEFTIIEGPFKGRKLFHDCWLTDAALPGTKRDLLKLGITSPEMMERPLPRWIRCKVEVVIRKDDDGIERNKIRAFEVIGLDQPEIDPFVPKGDADDPSGNGDTSTIYPESLDEEWPKL
jgi:hypothetical protein